MTRIDAPWRDTPAAKAVCGCLEDAGYQALFVGGCVRNALLSEPVADLDIATDAHPETVMSLGKAAGFHVVPTGIDHGTITWVVQGVPFEITTFRRDVATDGRRATVAFASNIAEDARRRDFTMNALYCDVRGVVHDPLDGLPDLTARRVRFIDDAEQRIQEDYLRILRFFRFVAWYGDQDLGIDPDGLAACAANIDGLSQLSRERVGAEVQKLLLAPDPGMALAAMAACGALMQVLPGAAPQTLPVLHHIEGQMALAPDAMRRLAAIGGDQIATRLRLSKKQTAQLEVLQKHITSSETAAALGYLCGEMQALDIIALRAASLGGHVAQDDVTQAKFGAQQVFPLTAKDLMPALTGPALGVALRNAEARWINSGFSLSKDALRP